ncbi:MAG: T9SS type A sorting domain-containing protein, partial [Ignavibacteriales bacterium]|nr:T9SS type A sorting domain-containing protein [Ignavibacteriales bacterium]
DTAGVPWLKINNGFGSLDSNQSTSIEIVVYGNMMSEYDWYNASLLFSSNDEQLQQQNITLSILHQEVLSVNENAVGVPKEVTLYQNYPNPFNPTTFITFGLPQTMSVTLNVYNVLGEEVAVLVKNTSFNAGTYSVPLEAADFASGMYFYRLTVTHNDVPGYTQTKRLLLLK